MATNVTTDSIAFFERKLKNEQIHLSKAIDRWENAKIKLAKKKLENPKKYGDRPDLADESSEIINCRKICKHFELAIQAIKEKQAREEGIKFNVKKRERKLFKK